MLVVAVHVASDTTVSVKRDSAELFTMKVMKSLLVKNGSVVGEPLTGKMVADALPWLLNGR
jgi:hypothetical protein